MRLTSNCPWSCSCSSCSASLRGLHVKHAHDLIAYTRLVGWCCLCLISLFFAAENCSVHLIGGFTVQRPSTMWLRVAGVHSNERPLRRHVIC